MEWTLSLLFHRTSFKKLITLDCYSLSSSFHANSTRTPKCMYFMAKNTLISSPEALLKKLSSRRNYHLSTMTARQKNSQYRTRCSVIERLTCFPGDTRTCYRVWVAVGRYSQTNKYSDAIIREWLTHVFQVRFERLKALPRVNKRLGISPSPGFPKPSSLRYHDSRLSAYTSEGFPMTSAYEDLQRSKAKNK